MKAKPIITLLTDFGLKDAYVAAIKGAILKINPDVHIVDISHLVPPQDITSASYILNSAWGFFPEGTIHIAVVDPGVGSSRRLLCAEIAHQYFLVPDNGILTLLLKRHPLENAFHLTNTKYFLKDLKSTFHGRDIFAPVAAHLSLGVRAESMGKRITEALCRLDMPTDVSRQGVVKGEIIHIDGFGNLITSIEKDIFTQYIETCTKMEPMVYIKGHRLHRIHHFYAETKRGELLALWNSSDFLELSVNQGNARDFLKAKIGDSVCLRILPLRTSGVRNALPKCEGVVKHGRI